MSVEGTNAGGWNLTEDGLIVSVVLDDCAVRASDCAVNVLLPVTADPKAMVERLEGVMRENPALVNRARSEVQAAIRKCSRNTYWESRELARRSSGSEEDIFARLSAFQMARMRLFYSRYFGLRPVKPRWVREASEDALRSLCDASRRVCDEECSLAVFRMLVSARLL
eukprot:3757845-Prymnesium_polylepis.1